MRCMRHTGYEMYEAKNSSLKYEAYTVYEIYEAKNSS